MAKKLRVGIVGAGGIARGAHIPGYKAILDEVELVAICDVDITRAEQLASEHDFGQAYSDYEKMLAEANLDAVSVCTPNRYHAPVTLAALKAGCHVLCEKPPAMSVDEAEAMVSLAEKSGKVLTFGLHFRYSSEVSALKKIIQAGELGNIYAGRVTAIRRRGIPGWGVFTNKELQGGGPVIDIGVHMLDTALYLMDYPKPKQVLATTYQKIGSRPGVGAMGKWDWENFQVEDLAMGFIKFENGASLLLESSFAANIEPMEEMNVRLMGTEGGSQLRPLKIFKEYHDTLMELTPAWLPRVDRPHTEEVKGFVQACLGKAEPMVKGVEAVRLQAIIDAIYASAESDTMIEL